jgi:cobyrinic acid a,c-diamide synthase
VLNQVSSARHESLLREALAPAGIPVVGALPREAALHTPSRHLGLVPTGERTASVHAWLPALRELVDRHLDLDLLMGIARSAPELTADAWCPPGRVPGKSRRPPAPPPRVAVAAGPAFTFSYTEHDELLAAAGAEVVTFDPLAAERLPEATDALVVGGGFPEVQAGRLAANVALRDEVSKRAARGMPIVAECAGLLWLGAALDTHAQCGVVPAHARMTGTLTLGYREATALRDSPLLAAGTRIRAHEFHRTVSEPAHGDEPAWQLADGTRHGWAGPSLLASYLHLHWAGQPQAAARLVQAARASQLTRGQAHAAGAMHPGGPG